MIVYHEVLPIESMILSAARHGGFAIPEHYLYTEDNGAAWRVFRDVGSRAFKMIMHADAGFQDVDPERVKFTIAVHQPEWYILPIFDVTGPGYPQALRRILQRAVIDSPYTKFFLTPYATASGSLLDYASYMPLIRTYPNIAGVAFGSDTWNLPKFGGRMFNLASRLKDTFRCQICFLGIGNDPLDLVLTARHVKNTFVQTTPESNKYLQFMITSGRALSVATNKVPTVGFWSETPNSRKPRIDVSEYVDCSMFEVAAMRLAAVANGNISYGY